MPGALACRSVSVQLALISPGSLPVSSFFETVTRGASPLGGLEIGGDRRDQRVRSGVRFSRCKGNAAGETLLEKTPVPARLRRGDGNRASITLSRRSFHSSAVKFDLSG